VKPPTLLSPEYLRNPKLLSYYLLPSHYYPPRYLRNKYPAKMMAYIEKYDRPEGEEEEVRMEKYDLTVSVMTRR
jgi:hypothetical protein